MAIAARGGPLAAVYDGDKPADFLSEFQAHVGPLRGAPAAAAANDLATPLRNMRLGGEKETPKGGTRSARRGTPASGAAS